MQAQRDFGQKKQIVVDGCVTCSSTQRGLRNPSNKTINSTTLELRRLRCSQTKTSHQTDLLGRQPFPRNWGQIPTVLASLSNCWRSSMLRAGWRKAGSPRGFTLWNLHAPWIRTHNCLVHPREGEGGALNEESGDKSEPTARRCALRRLDFSFPDWAGSFCCFTDASSANSHARQV